MHDIAMGRSVTGILHLVNKTPIEWYSKKQATVETATYGLEFVAARVCVEQIIDLRNTLRFLGVLVREKSYMFGDNKSVVDSSMQLNAKLHKRHKGSNSSPYPWFLFPTRRWQPCWHPLQTLGIYADKGKIKVITILERRYCKSQDGTRRIR
jgi:hypothetical protein